MPNGFQTLDSRLKPFLLSQLWEERNEMPLSLLSAFARLDLDPWSEAAALAELPRERAASRLAALVARMSGAPSNHDEVMGLCGSLIARLPAANSAALSAGVPPLFPKRERLVVMIVCSSLIAHAMFVIISAQHQPQPVPKATTSALPQSAGRTAPSPSLEPPPPTIP